MFIAVETIWLNAIRINKERRKEQSWQTHPATITRAALGTISRFIFVRMVCALKFLFLLFVCLLCFSSRRRRIVFRVKWSLSLI